MRLWITTGGWETNFPWSRMKFTTRILDEIQRSLGFRNISSIQYCNICINIIFSRRNIKYNILFIWKINIIYHNLYVAIIYLFLFFYSIFIILYIAHTFIISKWNELHSVWKKNELEYSNYIIIYIMEIVDGFLSSFYFIFFPRRSAVTFCGQRNARIYYI